MLSKADNELLCRVEPGTPMHEAFKRYWLIAGLSSDFPEPDSAPQRSTLLCEDYVLFRDSEGRMGCLRELCCHRGASLCLGRVEQGGIRCIYHGWKFNVDGQVLDTPNASDERVKQRYRQPSFPTIEKGGLIWVYLGPRDEMPAEPDYRWLSMPEHQVFSSPVVYEANYTQVIDGGADSSHLTILHQDALGRPAGGFDPDVRARVLADAAPHFDTYETDFGQFSAAIRTTHSDEGSPVVTCRSSAFIVPSTVLVTGGRPNAGSWAMAVPVTSERTIFYVSVFDDSWDGPDQRLQGMRFMNVDPETLDRLGYSRGTVDRPDRAGRANNWMQDRAAMRAGEKFTGLALFIPEDIAVAESMGAIFDRSEENLVPADQAVVRIRRILLNMARDVQAGRKPKGIATPVEDAKIYCTEVQIEDGLTWQEAALPPEFVKREPAIA